MHTVEYSHAVLLSLSVNLYVSEFIVSGFICNCGGIRFKQFSNNWSLHWSSGHCHHLDYYNLNSGHYCANATEERSPEGDILTQK